MIYRVWAIISTNVSQIKFNIKSGLGSPLTRVIMNSLFENNLSPASFKYSTRNSTNFYFSGRFQTNFLPKMIYRVPAIISTNVSQIKFNIKFLINWTKFCNPSLNLLKCSKLMVGSGRGEGGYNIFLFLKAIKIFCLTLIVETKYNILPPP